MCVCAQSRVRDGAEKSGRFEGCRKQRDFFPSARSGVYNAETGGEKIMSRKIDKKQQGSFNINDLEEISFCPAPSTRLGDAIKLRRKR